MNTDALTTAISSTAALAWGAVDSLGNHSDSAHAYIVDGLFGVVGEEGADSTVTWTVVHTADGQEYSPAHTYGDAADAVEAAERLHNESAITYTVAVDHTETAGTWYGDRAEAIEAAWNALAADLVDDGYHYDDDATQQRYAVTDDDMARLGAALLDGHTLGAVYSVWCAGTVATEVGGYGE